MKVWLRIIGCDDSTEFDIECNAEQYKFLQSICEKSKDVSEYRCMPVMEASACGAEVVSE